MSVPTALILCSSLSFFLYGAHCLGSAFMKGEFRRFGLENLRVLTGLLELMGALGLLVGLGWPLALWVSSGGLSLLMFLGLLARARVKEGWVRSLPALGFMLLNLYILMESLGFRLEAGARPT